MAITYPLLIKPTSLNCNVRSLFCQVFGHYVRKIVFLCGPNQTLHSMATVQNPITGRSKGKFANAIFSKWKGRNTLRSKPLEVANPQTPAQVQQRDSFAAAMAFARSISAIIYVGFSQFRDTISEFNAFMKEAYTGWVDKSLAPPAFQFDWSLLTVAKGPISTSEITNVASVDADARVYLGHLTVVSGSGQSLTDLAYGVVYNETQDVVGYDEGGTDRTDAQCIVTMPSLCATGDVLHCYLFFKSADGTDVSDSVYSTFVTTA
jgi:hypothetical protein